MDKVIENILQESAKRLSEAFALELRTKDLTRFGPAINTGKAADSIEYELREDGFLITGIGYIKELLYGRKPGTQPPLSAIEQWMKEKGLEGSAFPIARAIAEKGTLIFQTHNGGTSGLFEQAIKEESRRISPLLAAHFRELYIQSVFD